MTTIALSLPRLELLRTEVRALGADTWRVRIAVANSGWLPAYVTKRALARKTVRGVMFEIHLPENDRSVSLVSGKPRMEGPQLEGPRAEELAQRLPAEPRDHRRPRRRRVGRAGAEGNAAGAQRARRARRRGARRGHPRLRPGAGGSEARAHAAGDAVARRDELSLLVHRDDVEVGALRQEVVVAEREGLVGRRR